MRVAMGLALNEGDPREPLVLQFYEALSSFRFIPSDLILSHAGTRQPFLADASAADSSDLWIDSWNRDILKSLDSKRIRVPDIFMKRVQQQGSWHLLDADEAGDLQECGSGEFEKKYLEYEQKAERGEMKFAQRMNAVDLWHEIVESVAQTGQPWFNFRNVPGGAAVGPVGAINLAAHISETGAGLDEAQLRATVASAVRMLDNAVDLNLFPSEQARLAALEFRPIGLGVVGLQEVLDRLHIECASAAAADFADWSMELIAHAVITSSAELARERGPFPGCGDSNWSQGLLPCDSMRRLSLERGDLADVSANAFQDWASLRDTVRRYGIRNSAATAITPMDIPAGIAGVAPFPDSAGVETDAAWLIQRAARSQKWTDAGQTLVLCTAEKGIAKLGEILMQAWEKGIKTVHLPCVAARRSSDSKKMEPVAMA